MNGVKELSCLAGLFFASITIDAFATEPGATPESPPAAAPSAAADSCIPACRTGFVCNQGTCVSLCNPPCASSEVCTAAGQCLQLAPAPVAALPAAQPSAPGYAGTSPNAVDAPSERAEDKTPVVAAPLGKGLNVIFSAENLFGLEFAWETDTPTKSGGTSVSGREYDSYSENSVFFGNARTVNLEPRLGVDVAISGFTIGGTLMYASHSGDQTSKTTGNGLSSATSTTSKDPDFSVAGAGMRAGFVTMFTNTVGIWPRLGLSYRHESRTYTADTTTTTTSPYTSFNASTDWVLVEPELLLVVSPVSHFGILVGVGGNVSVMGSYKSTYSTSSTADTTTEGDLTGKTLHLSVGLAGYI